MAKQIRDYRQTTKHDEGVEVILTENFGEEERSMDSELPKLTDLRDMRRSLTPPLELIKSSPRQELPDEFYMAQSLYDQFLLKDPRTKFQLLYAFVLQSANNFDLLEHSLQEGKKFIKFVIRQFLSLSSTWLSVV